MAIHKITNILNLRTPDADGAVASQSAGAGGATLLIINGADVSTFDHGILPGVFGTGLAVRATSDANDSGVTATITGTLNDVVVSEELALPNATTADTTQLFDKITSISLSAATTGNVKFGTSGDDDGLVTSATLSSGEQTFNGAFRSGTAEFIDSKTAKPSMAGITSAGDDSGLTFTVKGTNRYDNVISETITGANASEAVSLLAFKTITEVKVSGDTASTVTVGNTDETCTEWFQVDMRPQTLIGFGVDINDNTCNYDVEFTYQGLNEDNQNDAVYDHDTVVGETANDSGNIIIPVDAFRLRVNSYTVGSDPTIQFDIRQVN